MTTRRYKNFEMDKTFVEEVIISTAERRGKGIEGDPIRIVTKVYSKEGELIAESDPCQPLNDGSEYSYRELERKMHSEYSKENETILKSALNDDKGEQKPSHGKQDWEIVSYGSSMASNALYTRQSTKNSGYLNNFDNPQYWISRQFFIKSVKRLSDNVVFTVGDEVYRETDANRVVATIGSFNISGNGIVVETKLFQTLFHILQKHPPASTKPVLFTTEDGQPVYDREPYWTVNEYDWEVCRRTPNAEQQTFLKEWLTSAKFYHHAFSTEQAAKDYVLMNKPCLSVSDLLGLWSIDNIGREQLKRFAQSKTK